MNRMLQGPERGSVGTPGGHTVPLSIVADGDEPPSAGFELGAVPRATGGEHSAAERLWFDDVAAQAPRSEAARNGNAHDPEANNGAAHQLAAQGGGGNHDVGHDLAPSNSPPTSNSLKEAQPASGAADGAGPGADAALARPRIDALFAPPPLPQVDVMERPKSQQARVLARICEPLFQRVCKLNRMRRAGFPDGPPRPAEVRAELLQALESALGSTPPRELGQHLAALELPLRCFMDLLMTRGGFGFEGSWERLAAGAAGTPERLLVDAAAEALADPAPAALERLEVLQVCLCLSAHLIEPAPVQRPVAPLMQRAGSRLSLSGDPRFSPTAYEGVFTRAVLTPVGHRLRLLAGVSAAILLLAIAGAVALNWHYCRQLDGSIDTVRAAMDEAGLSDR